MGGRAACRCIATDELPLLIPAGESRTFACEFLFQGAAGQFQYPFTLFTNDGAYSETVAWVSGKVVESTER